MANKKRAWFDWLRTKKTDLLVKRTPIRMRNFDAGRTTRFTTSWTTSSEIFNDEIRKDITVMRARSRDASKNDVYARRYFKVIKQNVVGPDGMKLKMAIRTKEQKLDKLPSMIIEQRWATFSKAVTVDGLNLRQTLGLFLETTARDGEVFAIIRRGDDFGKHKIQVQLLEAEYLDKDFNGTFKNGNIVTQGIEYDKFFRPVAYHFWEQFPTTSNTSTGNNKKVRVEAEDVIHGYDRERCSQGRGYPWLSSSLEALKQIKDYKEYELVASVLAASKMGFYITKEGEQFDADFDDPADPNAVVQEIEPGLLETLPAGYDFKMFDPQHPNGNLADFIKANLRGVASSVGLSYNTLNSDAESTSYSSLRQHRIDEDGTYQELQQFLIDTFLNRLFEAWLKWMIIMRLDNILLKPEGFDRYNTPTWRTRKRQWVDPAKETSAIQVQLDYGLRSRTDVARSIGIVWNDMADEIAAERAYAESIGLDLSVSDVTRALDTKLLEAVVKDNNQEDENAANKHKKDN